MQEILLFSGRLALIVAVAFPGQFAYAGKGELVFDVSGKAGNEAEIDGRSYSDDAGRDGSGNGHHGAHGGHAPENPFKNGENAGELYLNLSYIQNQTGTEIVVQGHQVKPGYRIDPGAREVLETRVPLTPQTRLRAMAIGGRGARGGNGGKGQDGGRGQDGQDAYHIGHSPVAGTDGKDGGRGGNAGDATDGGDAGLGGKIDVRVSIFDTDLAMLLEGIDVSGNKGGQRGKSLGPGSGGAGGQGGSSDSISWQEKIGEEPIYSQENITNSEGEVIGSQPVQTGTRDIMTTRSSYAPGGSSGRSGSDGRPSTKSVQDGRDSKAGQFRYIVRDEDGTEQAYQGPYRLTLQPGYKLAGDLNKSGFFEPGETIHIKDLEVINSGQSPTPKHQKIKIFVGDSEGWIRSAGIELEVPRVLNPGESHRFTKDEVAFYLEDHPRKKPGVLQAADTLGPKARVTRVEREFRGFNQQAQAELKIRYPLEITPLVGLETLSAGEVGRVYFKLKNVSSQIIGRSEGDGLRRAHTQLVRRGGNTAEEEFFILPQVDGEFSETKNGLVNAVNGLKPGEEVVIEALVGLGNNPKPYTDVEIHPEVHLESPQNPDRVRKIQYNPFTLRVSQAFKRSENADILLVANHSLNDKVLDALRYTAQVKNLTMDIWDFSYYGFFNMRQNIEGWESFFAAYRGKTIMILGNSISTPVGGQTAHGTLSPDQVIEAARRFGIRFLIFSTSESDAVETIARLTEPAIEQDAVVPYSSVKQFLRELKLEVQKYDEEIDGDESQDMSVSEVGVSKRYFWWNSPKEQDLRNQGIKLLAQGRGLAPEASLFVDYTFVPEQTGKWWGRIYRLGSLRVSRSVDSSRMSVAATAVSAKELQDPKFIMSSEFQKVFDAGLHIDTKLKLIGSILRGEFLQIKDVPAEYTKLTRLDPEQFAQALMDSVYEEILHEQVQIRPQEFKGNLTKQSIRDKLDILYRAASFDYGQTELDPSTPEGKLLFDFIVRVKTFTRQMVPVSQRIYANTLGWMLGRPQNLLVSEVTDDLIDQLIKSVFSDALIPEVEKAVKASTKERLAKAEAAGLAKADGLVRNGNYDPKKLNERVRNTVSRAELAELDKAREARAQEVRAAIFDDFLRVQCVFRNHSTTRERQAKG